MPTVEIQTQKSASDVLLYGKPKLQIVRKKIRTKRRAEECISEGI
jgi:hypothetical protein